MSKEHSGVPCRSLMRNRWNTEQGCVSTQQVHPGCRWKREGCAQRDLRGGGYSNSSRESLTWTKIWKGHKDAFKLWLRSRPDRTRFWLSGYCWRRGIGEREKKLKMTPKFLVFIDLCIKYLLINILYQTPF